MTTEEPGRYDVPRKGQRRRAAARARRSPRANAPRPTVWVVYRGQSIEVIGVYTDPVLALEALGERRDARVMKAAG